MTPPTISLKLRLSTLCSAAPTVFQCVQVQYGAGEVLSVVRKRNSQSVREVGAAIITRAARDDIQGLTDIREKKVGVSQLNQLSGCLAQWAELERNSISLFGSTAQVRFCNTTAEVLASVARGDIDVGFINPELLDNDTLPTNFFKVVGARTYPTYPYQVSTELYPEWLLFSMVNTNETVLREVSLALLRLPADAAPLLNASVVYFRPSYGYGRARTLLDTVDMIVTDMTGNQRCRSADDVYPTITCPAGYQKLPESLLTEQCALRGLACPSGYYCICSPCIRFAEPKRVAGLAIPQFVAILFVLLGALILMSILVYRLQAMHISFLKYEDIVLDKTPIIGKSKRGNILKGKYRGTAVVIKRAIARSAPGKCKPFDDRDDTGRWTSAFFWKVYETIASWLTIPTTYSHSCRRAYETMKVRHPNIVSMYGNLQGVRRMRSAICYGVLQPGHSVRVFA